MLFYGHKKSIQKLFNTVIKFSFKSMFFYEIDFHNRIIAVIIIIYDGRMNDELKIEKSFIYGNFPSSIIIFLK